MVAVHELDRQLVDSLVQRQGLVDDLRQSTQRIDQFPFPGPA